MRADLRKGVSPDSDPSRVLIEVAPVEPFRLVERVHGVLLDEGDQAVVCAHAAVVVALSPSTATPSLEEELLGKPGSLRLGRVLVLGRVKRLVRIGRGALVRVAGVQCRAGPAEEMDRNADDRLGEDDLLRLLSDASYEFKWRKQSAIDLGVATGVEM